MATQVRGTQQVYPFCARCRRPVQRADVRVDSFADILHLTAWCHGETETQQFHRDPMKIMHQAVMFRPLPAMREDEPALGVDDER